MSTSYGSTGEMAVAMRTASGHESGFGTPAVCENADVATTPMAEPKSMAKLQPPPAVSVTKFTTRRPPMVSSDILLTPRLVRYLSICVLLNPISAPSRDIVVESFHLQPDSVVEPLAV